MEDSSSPDSPQTAARTPVSTTATTRPVLVDDNDALRKMIMRALRDHKDLEIVGEATNGHEALEVVRQARPDVVVMDLRMPKMDGVEATAQIKSEFPDVTIVALSSDASLLEAVLAAGASDFIFKGDPIAELIERLRPLDGGPADDVSAVPTPVQQIGAQTSDSPAVPTTDLPDEPDYPPETPIDLRAELELNPKARSRFLTMPSEERRELLAYIASEDGRRDARIVNIVMSLDY